MKKVIIDVEANSLTNPTKIWVIVCKDLDTGEHHVFKNVALGTEAHRGFALYVDTVDQFIGHNILNYDLPVLKRLIEFSDVPFIKASSNALGQLRFVDTLICSKLLNYSKKSHSLEAFGEELVIVKEKNKQSFFNKFSEEMVYYCIKDTDINELVYKKYRRYIEDPEWYPALNMEHEFQYGPGNDLEKNGFAFNKEKAEKLLEWVNAELARLDAAIHKDIPPRTVLIREFTPKATKFGTINKSSVPRVLHNKIHEYEVGVTYKHTKEEPFNPASHKQLIDVLSEAGWSPTDKTKTHIETERAVSRLKYTKQRGPELDLELANCYTALLKLKIYGWQINEANLATLPPTAPASARSLAKRILMESRRRTLTEWLSLVKDDGRIHGRFYGIGAWTHRMAHQSPNTANIPVGTNLDGSPKLLGKELRQLWQAPRNRLLVGVDAEGIQLRIFAHYINDEEFTDALVRGDKKQKTDPHSLNQRILGSVCKSRAAAKRFIFALLLGAGLGKLAQILECSKREAEEALDNLLERYTGFAYLKERVVPLDAERGYFTGLDGRRVRIPGDTVSQRKHLCMSGYLQNGEAIVMKKATLHWYKQIPEELSWLLVNLVHDEWQLETENNIRKALQIAEIVSDSLKAVGEELKLLCPLAGSFRNEDINDYTIGKNWYVTH